MKMSFVLSKQNLKQDSIERYNLNKIRKSIPKTRLEILLPRTEIANNSTQSTQGTHINTHNLRKLE